MTDRNNKGLIFNIQKFSIQDGPGIRTTVFMKGCPLRCPWCSNPEGMSSEPEIMTHDAKCIGCGKCAEACPIDAISFTEEEGRIIDWERCNNCLECAEVCPSKSIEAKGEYKTVEEVFEVAAQDEPFYRNSGGGITVSGGEALLQWEFVLAFFKKCKQANFHTTLDTTAYCKWEHMEKVLEYTDLILFDVKNMDPEKHKEKCGVDNKLILENLEKAAKKTKLWLRLPLVPGYNDSEADIRLVAELAKRTNAEKVSVLPYHEYGKQKYSRVGKEYNFDEADILAPEDEIVIRIKEILESYDLNVGISG